MHSLLLLSYCGGRLGRADYSAIFVSRLQQWRPQQKQQQGALLLLLLLLCFLFMPASVQPIHAGAYGLSKSLAATVYLKRLSAVRCI